MHHKEKIDNILPRGTTYLKLLLFRLVNRDGTLA